MPNQHVVLRWSAYEHEHVERGSDWYWALGIVAVSAALTSILFDDFLFAVLILLAAVVLVLLSRTPPERTRAANRIFWSIPPNSWHPISSSPLNTSTPIAYVPISRSMPRRYR